MEKLAEGEGFEPPDLSVCGFQDRRLKPLGHPSWAIVHYPPPVQALGAFL